MSTDYSDFTRPPTVFIALDPQCYSKEKEFGMRLGGSEIYLLRLFNWLKEDPKVGWWVTANTKPNEIGHTYDIAIHSNIFMRGVLANKHICFAGSLHSDASKENYDLVVNVSEHMRKITKKGTIIPACVGNDVKKEYAISFVPGRIVCNANPNKWMYHLEPILDVLNSSNTDYTFQFCGGNQLYSKNFPELWTIPERYKDHRIQYKGILSRFDMLGMLSQGHVFILPAFTGEAPTFEVSPLEAMKMGITTILPNRSPYNEVHGPLGAILCNNEKDMANEIIKAFSRGKTDYDISKYSEASVKEQWLKLIGEMI